MSGSRLSLARLVAASFPYQSPDIPCNNNRCKRRNHPSLSNSNRRTKMCRKALKELRPKWCWWQAWWAPLSTAISPSCRISPKISGWCTGKSSTRSPSTRRYGLKMRPSGWRCRTSRIWFSTCFKAKTRKLNWGRLRGAQSLRTPNCLRCFSSGLIKRALLPSMRKSLLRQKMVGMLKTSTRTATTKVLPSRSFSRVPGMCLVASLSWIGAINLGLGSKIPQDSSSALTWRESLSHRVFQLWQVKIMGHISVRTTISFSQTLWNLMLQHKHNYHKSSSNST